MDVKHIVVSVNMRAGEILTLEKTQERMEYEAFHLPSELTTRDCQCNHGPYCEDYSLGN